MIITTKQGSIKSDTEGMLLTDGKTFCVECFLSVGRSVDEFHEISREEYEAIMANSESDAEVT